MPIKTLIKRQEHLHVRIMSSKILQNNKFFVFQVICMFRILSKGPILRVLTAHWNANDHCGPAQCAQSTCFAKQKVWALKPPRRLYIYIYSPPDGGGTPDNRVLQNHAPKETIESWIEASKIESWINRTANVYEYIYMYINVYTCIEMYINVNRLYINVYKVYIKCI